MHTGYTEQLPGSLDGKCNTTSLVQIDQSGPLALRHLAGAQVRYLNGCDRLRLVLPILVRRAILFGYLFLLGITRVLLSRRLRTLSAY